MIRSKAFVYFVVTVWDFSLLTAAPRTGISNLHELQKYSLQSLPTIFKMSTFYQRSLNVCYVFAINAFIDVYYYFVDIKTHLGWLLHSLF